MIQMKRVQLDTIADLHSALQTAIELEHATLPPYLTARFSLFQSGNDAISDIIGTVVNEEMLHLSIACNLLNAVGGAPVLNKPGFIPTYPGPLPGSVEEGLTVPLEKFSKDLVKNVFMIIEEPEDPIEIQRVKMDDPDKLTIGEFYGEIKKQITRLEREAQEQGSTIFTGDPSFQMTYEKFYPLEILYPITNEKLALHAIDIIVDQGEGSATTPFVTPGDSAQEEVAHYYRFEEIYEGKTILPDPNDPGKYIFGAPEIPFDDSKVANMRPNPKMDDYPKDSHAYENSRIFNYNYTALLNCLHETFNGEPQKINDAMGLMFALRLYAFKLMAIPDPNHPEYVCGPSFEYVLAK